jgi:myo-inositol-1-phosphate synthase
MIRGPMGNLGTMVVGIGAVATTLIAGVEAVRKRLANNHQHIDTHQLVTNLGLNYYD